jgi:hypothetical protein
MGIVQIGNFGISDGVQTYRVNGHKEDLDRIIHECLEQDAIFENSPELEKLRNGQWTLLLKLRVRVEAKRCE